MNYYDLMIKLRSIRYICCNHKLWLCIPFFI